MTAAVQSRERPVPARPPPALAEDRLDERSALDPQLGADARARLETELDLDGCSVLRQLITPAQSRALASLYADQQLFRSTVVMARHNFGRGEYKYFDYPLPPLVATLRTTLYSALAPIANRWHAALGLEATFPDQHSEYLARCREAGQLRPTPLLLSYGPGDYNCLHQDLYGELVFPLQVAILLSDPERDFSGGELVLTEQRPRMQSRVQVVPLAQGDAVVFAVRDRPVSGKRGTYRVKMRHGVSRVHSGQRRVMGIIFHDAT
jgi:hypothetical protein